MIKFYDEKVYLDDLKNKDAIHELELYRNDYIMKKAANELLFSNEISMYNEYLQNVSNFIKTLDFTTSIEKSSVILHLIEKGYLSYKEEYKYKEGKKECELKGYEGMNVLYGNVCCRHVASIFYDIARLCDVNVSKLYCNSCESRLLDFGTHKEADHMANLIEYNGNLYGFDISSGGVLFYFMNNHLLKGILLHSNLYFHNKPYYEFIREGYTLEDIRTEMKYYDEESKKDHIGVYDYRDMREKVDKKLSSLKMDLEELKKDNDELCIEIYNGVNSKIKKLTK